MEKTLGLKWPARCESHLITFKYVLCFRSNSVVRMEKKKKEPSKVREVPRANAGFLFFPQTKFWSSFSTQFGPVVLYTSAALVSPHRESH